VARKPKVKQKTKRGKAQAQRTARGASKGSAKRSSSKSSWPKKSSTRRKPSSSSWEPRTPGRVRPGDTASKPTPTRAVATQDSGDPRIVQGKLLVNPAGFAFVDRGNGEPSVFVPPPERNGGMDGDEVIVSWWPGNRGPEGSVRSVLSRARTRVTGVLRRQGRRLFIEPDDPRVLGDADVLADTDAEPGMVVVATIVDYPDAWNDTFSVTVDRVLGEPGSLATEEERILVEHGVNPQLPQAVIDAAELVPTRVLKADRENRADLREFDFMTIDPPDARDFDDAVCVELLGKDPRRAKMRVHVAVADVSHYVHEGDIFDTEARNRYFSCYLPARVIPMLPMPLSAGICSLVPKKERCAMVVSFDVDASGRMGKAEVAAAVIKSKARLTYDQVAGHLSGERPLDEEVGARVTLLRAASDRLRNARLGRGAVELHLPETKVILDEDDRERVRDVVQARQDPEMKRAYNLIEELMVAANEGVGRLAVEHRLPVVYRVHDRPDEARVERFTGVAGLLGVEVAPEDLRSPLAFAALLERIEGHERRAPLNALLLRTLAQAEYSTHNLGHFALASEAYVHFTSPIRRYPDLISHRVLKAWLRQRGGFCGPDPVPRMPAMRDSTAQAEASSEKERGVTQAERDAKSLLCAAFMRDRIGDRFEASINGMSQGGLYVTLDAPAVDGMVRRAQIEREFREKFDIDEMGAVMTGLKSGRTLAVGDRLVVEVTGVSLQRRQIEMAMVSKLTVE